MTHYRVAGPLMGMATGDVVTDSDLQGCNIGALVEGGHLIVVPNPKRSKPQEDTDNGA